MPRGAQGMLSTAALIQNLGVLARQAPHSLLLGMVKANAYGHGIRSVAKRLEGRVGGLGVASLEEALVLRSVGIRTPIILMEGVFSAQEYHTAVEHQLACVVHSVEQLAWLEEARLFSPLSVWLKFDTGLGRLGFPWCNARVLHERVMHIPGVVQPVGIISHFACAEDGAHELTGVQRERCRALTNIRPAQYSFCNSAALFNFPDMHFDMVRPGLSLYGVSPWEHVSASELMLRPVMTLCAQLIAIRWFEEGDTLGYGARYRCAERMRIGVMAMGYGDGLARTTRDGAPVYIRGKQCALVGRVSMDMATIDLRACPEAQVGDRVIIWGDGAPLELFAPWTEQSPYDLLTGVQARVPFVWE